jgi:hypothetical protein
MDLKAESLLRQGRKIYQSTRISSHGILENLSTLSTYTRILKICNNLPLQYCQIFQVFPIRAGQTTYSPVILEQTSRDPRNQVQ